MCRCIKVPSHREIKRAIRFMPWGEEVYFFFKGKIRTGKLVGFETSIDENAPVVKAWKVFVFDSQIAGDTYILSVPRIFMFETEALKWAMKNTDLKETLL